MCIALPYQILAVVDVGRMMVDVAKVDGGDADHEIVSAALIVTPERPLDQLVGTYALIHAGFAVSLIDEEEARSRQQVFAALDGGQGAIDLSDFYESVAGVETGADAGPRHPQMRPRDA